MATFSTSFSSLIFLSPHNPTKRLKLSLYKPFNLEARSSVKILGIRIRAVKREESAVLDEKDRELAAKVNGSVNGSSNGNYGYTNGSVDNYGNGSVKFGSEDESLVKYVNGNGSGNRNVAFSSEGKVEKGVISEKKSIEDIGQEEAWFKKSGGDVEVYCCIYNLLCSNFL